MNRKKEFLLKPTPMLRAIAALKKPAKPLKDITYWPDGIRDRIISFCEKHQCRPTTSVTRDHLGCDNIILNRLEEAENSAMLCLEKKDYQSVIFYCNLGIIDANQLGDDRASERMNYYLALAKFNLGKPDEALEFCRKNRYSIHISKQVDLLMCSIFLAKKEGVTTLAYIDHTLNSYIEELSDSERSYLEKSKQNLMDNITPEQILGIETWGRSITEELVRDTYIKAMKFYESQWHTSDPIQHHIRNILKNARLNLTSNQNWLEY